MDFGNRLRDARNDSGLTGEKLGEALGVSKQTIAHWEANRYEPKLVFLAKLSEVLKVPVEWLLSGRMPAELSIAAIKQAKLYDSLSIDGKRKWEMALSLIREPVEPPMNRVAAPKPREITVGHELQVDTLDTNNLLELPFHNPSKSRKSDQPSSNPEQPPGERGEHAQGAPKTRRSRRT